MKIVKHLVDAAKGKHPISKRRSPEWPKVEKAYLASHPNCAICGRSNHLQVHHKVPFHIRPDLELDPSNLITLCEPRMRVMKCHLIFGHVGNFRLFNPKIASDAPYWCHKLNEAWRYRHESK